MVRFVNGRRLLLRAHRDEQLRAGRRLRRDDAWIAATALRHGVPVVTQDADFGAFASVESFASEPRREGARGATL